MESSETAAPAAAQSVPGDWMADCERHGRWQQVLIDERGTRRAHPGCPHCAQERRASEILQRTAIPQRFHDRTLANFETRTPGEVSALKVARDYVATFDDARRVGRCLVLLGNPGTGKTHLATGIARELAGAGRTAMFARAYEIINAIRSTWSGDHNEERVVSEFVSVDLLIIDEVGVQYGKESEQIELFKVINRRYDTMRPMIVISNHNVQGLEQYLGPRSFDRLREGGGRVVVFDWESHRKQ